MTDRATYLRFLEARGLDRRTRLDYVYRLGRVERLLGISVSPRTLSSSAAVKRLARRLPQHGVPSRSVVDCAVAMQRYFECFHGRATGPQHWIEVYWPSEPGKKRAEDGWLYLYFHRQKRNANDKVKKGDRVLFYETKEHPDEKWLGAQTIFAVGRVQDDRGEPIDPPGRSGGRTWVWCRAVKPSKILPPAKGIPLPALRRVLGWSSTAKLRRGPMLIEPEQFSALEEMLGQKRRLEPQGGRSRRGTLPRQPDVFKRLKLEREAVALATKWYEGQGYTVTSVERDRAGWDLEAVSESHRLLVEVKGLSGRQVSVGLTPNEYKMMRAKVNRKAYRLFIVTSGFGPKPVQHEFFYSNNPARWEAMDGRTLKIRELVGAIATC